MEATTLFDYSSQNPANEELSFSQGNLLKILDDTDINWYRAELNGKEGYVPVNYVQYTPPIWFMSVKKEEAVAILTAMNGSRPRHPDGAFIVRPSQNSPGDMSLSVKIGADVHHFRILRPSSRDQYYLWSDAPRFTSINQLVNHYHNTSVSKSSPSAVLRELKFAKVRADYDYQPQQETEMEIKRNDVITVIDKSDPDWWDGRVERDGVVYRGFFPSNYVSSVSD